jgi:hypothetical protein
VVLTAAARSVLSAAVIAWPRCRTVTVSPGCMRSMAAEAQPILLLRSSAAAYRPSTSGSVAKPSCSTLAQTWSALISAGPWPGLRQPERKRFRSSNLLERSLEEVKRRTK